MNIQAHRTEYQDVEGLWGLYHQESGASSSRIAEASRSAFLGRGFLMMRERKKGFCFRGVAARTAPERCACCASNPMLNWLAC
jgi:hypothetical protein